MNSFFFFNRLDKIENFLFAVLYITSECFVFGKSARSDEFYSHMYLQKPFYLIFLVESKFYINNYTYISEFFPKDH
jgi:hypothetical protein